MRTELSKEEFLVVFRMRHDSEAQLSSKDMTKVPGGEGKDIPSFLAGYRLGMAVSKRLVEEFFPSDFSRDSN